MSTEKKAKGNVDAKAEMKVNPGSEYRQPAVHDLGKLEQVQGGAGFNYDGRIAYIFRP